MANSTVHLSFLGREYEFNCPLDKKAQLRLAADDLESQLQEIHNSTNASREQVILMAALNLSFSALSSEPELKSEPEKRPATGHDYDQRIDELNKRVQTLIKLIGEATAQHV